MPDVCAEFRGISPALLLELWVPPEVLCLPCRMVPGLAVPQQEPLLGPCLCLRTTNLLPLGLCFLFQQLPFCANVVFFMKLACVVFRRDHQNCFVCLNQTWALLVA